MGSSSKEKWHLEGELVVNCNCDVFCPCVVSLGRSKPSQGYCQGWLATRIDSGSYGETDIAGINLVVLLDIPGRMTEGGWTTALYVDDKADDAQVAAIEAIFSGQAGGSSGLLKLLVANFLGTQRVPVSYDVEGDVRSVNAGDLIKGSLRPLAGAEPGEPVAIENSAYWVDSRIIVAQGIKSKVRDFGRVWSLDGKSAEICNISWSGP